MAEGLQAVHDAGIIHRDLKTPNIMRDAQGIARLMDFGVAKRHGAEGTATATGHIVGTPEYMSPEQAQGQKVDFRSDIYALGVVIYEMFTGQVPFRGETPISTILKHLHDPPPLEGPQAGSIPPALKPVLRKALAKEPAYRYPTATALAEALRQARTPSRRQQPVATEVLESPTLTRAMETEPHLRHHRRAWLGIVGGMAVAATVVVLQRHRPDYQPLPEGPAPTTAPPAAGITTPPVSAPAMTMPPAAALPPATVASYVAPPPKTASAPATDGRALPPMVPVRPSVTSSKRMTAPVAAPPTAPPIAPPTPAPTPVPTPVAAATPAPRVESPEPTGTGLLLVVARPWGNVRVDGTGMGTTPLDTISLKSGVHTVVVQHPSYEPIERKVTIRAGQTERLVVDFPAQGTRKQP